MPEQRLRFPALFTAILLLPQHHVVGGGHGQGGRQLAGLIAPGQRPHLGREATELPGPPIARLGPEQQGAVHLATG
ncbi:MAG: hypothetical protein DCF24_00690, partial [Cyanobium sp.]